MITSKLGLEKLKVQWGIRVRKEKKIKDIEKNRWVKVYWTEKQKDGMIYTKGKKKSITIKTVEECVIAIDNMVREERNLIKELKKRE